MEIKFKDGGVINLEKKLISLKYGCNDKNY